jgi:hypothetical protein
MLVGEFFKVESVKWLALLVIALAVGCMPGLIGGGVGYQASPQDLPCPAGEVNWPSRRSVPSFVLSLAYEDSPVQHSLDELARCFTAASQIEEGIRNVPVVTVSIIFSRFDVREFTGYHRAFLDAQVALSLPEAGLKTPVLSVSMSSQATSADSAMRNVLARFLKRIVGSQELAGLHASIPNHSAPTGVSIES